MLAADLLGPVGIGADQGDLAVPEGGEVEVQPAGHAHQHDPAPRAHHVERGLDRCGAPDAVKDDVRPAGQALGTHGTRPEGE